MSDQSETHAAAARRAELRGYFDSDSSWENLTLDQADDDAVERALEMAQDENHGVSFVEYVRYTGDVSQAVDNFEEAHVGSFGSRSEWYDYCAELAGWDMVEREIEKGSFSSLAPYVRFDAEAWSRDAELGGDFFIAEAGGEFHVFNCHV